MKANAGFDAFFNAALLLAAFALLPATAHAQAIEAWVQRYNGPGNGEDFAQAMAVDAGGNVYVMGNVAWGGAGYQCPTLAYSNAGVPLWTNSAGGPWGFSSAAAVDNSGNVYVTGVDGSGTGACMTIKYSSVGVPLWTNVDATSTSGRAVAMDASGNVFVTGPLSASPGSDWVTIKYSSAGVRLWARTCKNDGPSHPVAMAVDASGNVVVAGDTSWDYATTKYSSAGVLLWTERYNGPGNHWDEAIAVAVDSEGNVVVTGRSDGSSGVDSRDYATIKYSDEGVPLWTNRYNGLANDSDEPVAVAIEASGNVVVTGWSVGSGTREDYLTIKYSSAGVPLWTNRYDGPGSVYGAGSDRATAMVLDASGNVFVTGQSDDGGRYWDYATVAYSSAGMPLWTNRYNGPGNKRDVPLAVAVDASGNVYVSGSSEALGSGEDVATQNHDFATVKYVTPPILTAHPLSWTNAVGTTASFSVEVAGGTPLSYQWRKGEADLVDGGTVSGVTTANLLIADVQLADAGRYSVVLTNAYGSATSQVAQLTVVVPPSDGRLTDFAYSPTTGFTFIFRDGTVGQPYRIQRSPSLEKDSWVDWQSFTCTEPNAFLDLGAVTATNRFYRAVSP
ncbi:MAG TPA: immunoglobulin domain-containing protein [Candidatus Paceibacterota bacterium]|nr:immunoglobulin domain-containing protein [Candidatus Paceibacterota bacterium]